MNLDVKKNTFVKLGAFLSQFTTNEFIKNNDVCHNDEFFSAFEQLIYSSVNYNGWFTEEQVLTSIRSWADALTQENIDQWCSKYDFTLEPMKKVGLILAGNIPLVGFHDFLSVLMSGNIAVVKLSSNDQKLLPLLVKYIMAIEPNFADRIVFNEGKLEDFDAVIATGSNNTARYFDYYFSKVPNIIRKNRNSVAVLDGSESHEDMVALGKDVFTYYGLGCRNVSKLFVPTGFNFDGFYQGMFEYKDVIEYEKYSNNYDYNKAVFLMSDFKILDNGFLTVKEDKGYSSPISSVFFEYYDDLDTVQSRLREDSEKIQCVVSNGLVEGSIPFGKTQEPNLWDYADNVDTLEFLLNL
ncbi:MULTISPECIES: acyl-CoA reductase [Myroides]|uniref:Acyl-CoA reductase n=1 Tax=Myroides albus TaxID=2562892 RepID=A0A6I3LM74_9FLAO|nr:MULTISPECIES: acyl-CoA reductase [Myroides]MTG97671.1 acyl-CoA reductase [Myroides albus]MVX35670.1 acyl-CoA reductase [Myroides sp. LoEW2-1]UVD78783.1 acyl-CoA reductase [Myroides albus]